MSQAKTKQKAFTNTPGKYVDGFVITVPEKHLAEYKKVAKLAEQVWLEHGALEYKECVGDDLQTQETLPFTKLVDKKRNELVLFSFITYKSKAHRDSVNKKVMKDERMTTACDPESAAWKSVRMYYGGFKVFVG